MSVLDANSSVATDDDGVSDRPRCSCLPFCFGRRGSSVRSRRAESHGAEAAPGKPRHRLRRWRRFRLVIRLSSWLAFSWPPPWLRMKKSGKKKDCTKASTTTGKKQRTGRKLLLLLLKTSPQAKQALASVVVSGDGGGLLPVATATVSSFGDAKKQNRSRPRPAADGAAPSGTRSQPQASTAATGGTRAGRSTAPALPWTNQPCNQTATDEPAMAADRIWRAPSRRHSLQPQPGPVRACSGLWTAATTLGVIVLFGRVTAVVFLCSCLYGARFIWARAAGASAKNSGVDADTSSSSRRLGDPIGIAGQKQVAELSVTEECKKKVVMAGLLERTGKRPSSRFGR